jgi:peptidoglycan/xylan/chitin deacetylase (PgdA/CDA1 family)
MQFRTFIAALSAIASVSAAAIPTNSTSFAKRATVQTIDTCANSGQIALTFDDGPYIWQNNIRDSFAGGKGTLFLNGNNYGCIYDYADEIRDASAAGWTIGSHGWSHANMGELSWDQIHDELWRVEEAFIKILGLRPVYFRPPFGSVSDTLYAALENRGYKKVFMWSDDTLDASGASVAYSKSVYDGIAQSFPSPHIVLNHETVETTHSEVIPYAVPLLKNAGYDLVSVDVCLGSNGEWPYEWVGQPQQRDSTWHC